MIRTALGDRRGAITALVGVAGIVLIGMAGFALDVTRTYMVSARLKTAVDAAALLAAREIDTTATTRDAMVTAMFWSNYRANRTALAGEYIGSSSIGLTITQLDSSRMQVSGTATVPTTLFNVISPRTMTVTEVSVASRQAVGLEVALVIDQTSSMGAAAASGGTKLQAAQSAVGSLLDIMYGTTGSPAVRNATANNLYVSVVPFARTINIGTANSAMLATTGLPTGWNSATWGGCVEARYTGGNDLTEVSPTTAPFRPYFYRSTYQQVGTFNGAQCTTGNAYSTAVANPYATPPNSTTARFCFGDNDWGGPQLSTNPNYTSMTGNGLTAYVAGTTTLLQAAGPNLLCNHTAVLPLTADSATVWSRVNSMTPMPRSGGTDINAGLQGAWYTLSPNFRDAWSGTTGNGLPLDYNTRNMRKAIVMLTDGDNNWQTAYSANVRYPATTGTNGVASEFLYSGYGRGATWNANIGTPAVTLGTQSTADAALRSRFAQLCTAIKAQGILIYIIGFEINSATNETPANIRTMLQTCASGTGAPYFLESPDSTTLRANFQTIARSLSSLRLSE